MILLSCKALYSKDLEYIDISKLKEKIKLNASYKSPEIELTLTKENKDSLQIEIPSGYLFDSDSQKRQDLIIVKTYRFTFKGTKMKILLKGYCAQASKGAPRNADTYKLIGYHPDSNLIKLAQYIDSHPDIKENIQHAIWAITDHKNAAGINLSPSGRQLRNFLKTKDSTIDLWYTIEYALEETEDSIFSDKHLNLKGEISYRIGYPCMVTMVVKDKRGNIVQFLENRYKNQGTRTYDIELDIKKLPKGNYELLIYEDQTNLNCKFDFRI